MTEIWTDGSCRGNPGPGGWGAIVLKDGQLFYVMRGEHPLTTNNRMEMSAILWALENFGDKEQPLIIYSDSSYCINTFSDWMWKWKQNGWKRAKNKPVENLDLVKKYDSLVEDGFKAILKKVPGHSGVKWNEYADALATGALSAEEVIKLGG